jgi:hypothetical protein
MGEEEEEDVRSLLFTVKDFLFLVLRLRLKSSLL